MSTSTSRKRVRFSEEDVKRALSPEPPEEPNPARETLLPIRPKGKTEHKSSAALDEGPIKATNPEFAATLRARHRKEIDSLKVGEAVDISILDDVAVAEEENDDDTDVRFTDDGIPIEPFNLRAERRQGFFDEEGNYVAYRGGEDTDAWLETLPDGPISNLPGQAADKSSKAAGSSTLANLSDDRFPEMSQHDRQDYRQKIVQTLRPGETVLGALRRLGTSDSPSQATVSVSPEQQPASKADRLSATRSRLAGWVPSQNKESFHKITEHAGHLLNAGDTEIYSATREQLASRLQPHSESQANGAWSRLGDGLADEAASLTERLAAPLESEIMEVDERHTSAQAAPADPDADIFGDAAPPQSAGTPEPFETAAKRPHVEQAIPGSVAEAQRGAEVLEGSSEAREGTDLAGFAFDERSGMYYNTALGCYFDAKRQLYGDAASGRWYSYADGKYELVIT